MTLDKAIEVYEFWANAHERDAEYHRPLGYSHETTANVAEMQAREERQFAEWLKELKAYRETYPYGVEGYPPRADTPQTESTGSPIGDYRDGVGAWQTDLLVKTPRKSRESHEKDTPQTDTHDLRTDTHECVNQTDCGWNG